MPARKGPTRGTQAPLGFSRPGAVPRRPNRATMPTPLSPGGSLTPINPTAALARGFGAGTVPPGAAPAQALSTGDRWIPANTRAGNFRIGSPNPGGDGFSGYDPYEFVSNNPNATAWDVQQYSDWWDKRGTNDQGNPTWGGEIGTGPSFTDYINHAAVTNPNDSQPFTEDPASVMESLLGEGGPLSEMFGNFDEWSGTIADSLSGLGGRLDSLENQDNGFDPALLLALLGSNQYRDEPSVYGVF